MYKSSMFNILFKMFHVLYNKKTTTFGRVHTINYCLYVKYTAFNRYNVFIHLTNTYVDT